MSIETDESDYHGCKYKLKRFLADKEKVQK